MRLQRLVRDEDLPYASASDRWARFEVLDDGVRVGLVSEEHAWVNHGWGPASWTAVHDPTEDGRGVLWRGEGYASAAAALAALAAHLVEP